MSWVKSSGSDAGLEAIESIAVDVDVGGFFLGENCWLSPSNPTERPRQRLVGLVGLVSFPVLNGLEPEVGRRRSSWDDLGGDDDAFGGISSMVSRSVARFSLLLSSRSTSRPTRDLRELSVVADVLVASGGL